MLYREKKKQNRPGREEIGQEGGKQGMEDFVLLIACLRFRTRPRTHQVCTLAMARCMSSTSDCTSSSCRSRLIMRLICMGEEQANRARAESVIS